MVTAKKILVLDADMTPALTVVRSLARLGLHVDIASHIDKPVAGYSRHARLRLRYPDPMQDPQAFIDWLNTHAAANTYELVIPVTERTAVPLLRYRDRVNTARIALPANDSLEIALNKAKTVDLARQLGIPVPGSTLVAQAATLDHIKDTLAYPVVIKPARSMGSANQGIVQLGVDYAFNEPEFMAKTGHALRFGSVILQEYFGGQGVGIELIADHGKIAYAFQHLRLHEVPLTGGGSSFRKSVAIEPELLDAAQKLMAALNWHGVAMVEFKWKPKTRDFRLMEINGRFWGSLPLAVSAGADFPAMLYELLMQGRIAPRPPAQLGIERAGETGVPPQG
jgi:predicted ATP-grasp superfamily ATP-dependent carboligase